MKNADTAIVGNGIFIHYCHKVKGLMALRIHHEKCLLCSQRNPDYNASTIVFTVSNLLTGAIVLVFEDEQDAIIYMQSHPNDQLALGDTGYVNSGTI